MAELVKPKNRDAVAIFDIGLVSKSYENLYALFEERVGRNIGTPSWRLIGFCSRGEKLNGINYITYFRNLPPRAEYYQNPADLVYDVNLRLDPITDHILRERVHRLPPFILKQIPRDIKNDSNKTIGFLNTFLGDAINNAIQLIKQDRSTAVPQYSFEHKRIQFLIPLYITNPEYPDVALVVQREEEVYVGYTILPLDWAYSNARLIVKPETCWLARKEI